MVVVIAATVATAEIIIGGENDNRLAESVRRLVISDNDRVKR